MKNISNELTKLESEQADIQTKYLKLASTIPNLIHDSVPIGIDDSSNKEVKKSFNSLLCQTLLKPLITEANTTLIVCGTNTKTEIIKGNFN